MPAAIGPSSVLCAGGRGTEQLWATVRAGISGIKDSHLANRDVEPIPMGVIPEAALLLLPPELLTAGLPGIARRMLQIAAPVLRAVSTTTGTPAVVYLALPQLDGTANSWLGKFLEYLSICAEIPIDLAVSKIFPGGRAAAFAALEAALNTIEQNPSASLVVGGVDTYLDLRVIGVLDREKRILGNEVLDGFIPGEGAAFLVLKNSRQTGPHPDSRQVTLRGAATVLDAGHRYGTEPARGEGLADALQKLSDTVAIRSPISNTFAGFNGESFDAKLWGVARLRHTSLFSPDMVMQHPADCIGDTGAAAGAILTTLAAFALSSGNREGPTLIWAASDHELRGCALLVYE